MKSLLNESPPLQVPQWDAYDERCLSPEPTFFYLSRPPVKEPSLLVPLTELP